MAAVGTFPFIVKLEYMTKNDEWLYMIMSHVSVGNLLELINEEGHLNETTVRFFSSQVRRYYVNSIILFFTGQRKNSYRKY